MIWEGAAKDAAIETIIDRLMKGESLRQIMTGNDELPCVASFMAWVAKDEELAARYGVATQMGCDMLADEALAEATKKEITDPAAARLAFDARRWYVGKRHPKKYGDRVDLSHSGTINIGQALDALPDE